MDTSTGIIYRDGEELVQLPLHSLTAKVSVVDVSARVILSQIYDNQSNKPTSRSKYAFAVPAGAAVCAFEMKAEDGRVLLAVCKEKGQAREDYEAALHRGERAGLVEYVTDDIFTVSLGSIPPKQTVRIQLVYVMNLVNGDRDEIRVFIPMSVGRRYGPIPSQLTDASRPSREVKIAITADVQTSGRTISVTSPSHSNIRQAPYITHVGRPSNRRTTVKYRSSTYLEQDFVLLVRADGLDSPRCFVEVSSSQNDRRGWTTLAMQFMMIPKFEMPTTIAQEYIFLIDHSGSMQGPPLDTAKSTVDLLMRMLPLNGTVFNVFQFDNTCEGLWPKSVSYTQDTLHRAAVYTAAIADHGGTEIGKALKKTLNSRRRDMATVLFVLTDGEATDIDATAGVVRTAMSSATTENPLRVFTLGIGTTVSTAMCETIAKAGNGHCLLATSAEAILPRCLKLLQAGRTQYIKNITLDWGVELSSPTVTFSPVPTSTSVALRPAPSLQQSPETIQDLHAGVRLIVYAILTVRQREKVPDRVTLRGEVLTSNGVVQPIETVIPISRVQLKDLSKGVQMVHTLAAWALVQDLQERRATLPSSVLPANPEDIRRAAIVRLGEKYQIVSSYTSFVTKQEDTRSSRSTVSSRRTGNKGPTQRKNNWLQTITGTIFGMPSVSSSPTRSTFLAIPGAWPSSSSAASFVSSQPASLRTRSDRSRRDPSDSDDSADTFSTLSTLFGTSSSTESVQTPGPPELSSEEQLLQRSPSPELESVQFAPPPIREQLELANPPSAVTTAPPLPSIDSEVAELMKTQTYDGSFDASHISGKVGASHLVLQGAAESLQITDQAWSTALAIAFIMKQMDDWEQRALLDDLLAKPMDYLLANVPPDSLVAVIARAKELIN